MNNSSRSKGKSYVLGKVAATSQTEYERLQFELISAIHQDNEIAFDAALEMLDAFNALHHQPLSNNNNISNTNNNNKKLQTPSKSHKTRKWAWTPIMFAVHKKRLKFVQKFLDRGSNPNACDPKKSQTLLHMACEHTYAGYRDIAQQLLINEPFSANINACDKESQTPAFICCKTNNVLGLQLLLDYNIHGQICDINIPKLSNQHSCLYHACDKGYKEIVQLLLDYKCMSVNIDAVDNKKRFTPLMRAGMRNHVQIVQMLLAYGANICARNCLGRNSLMLSAKAHHSKICKLLLNNEESGEMINLWAIDIEGHDIFHFISQKYMDQRITKQIRQILYAFLYSVILDCCRNVPYGVIQAICVSTY